MKKHKKIILAVKLLRQFRSENILEKKFLTSRDTPIIFCYSLEVTLMTVSFIVCPAEMCAYPLIRFPTLPCTENR